ncbi:MAG: response regulator [Anaerolineae bacterium]|nr:response regulator [Anaerolineae bacterium]
MDNQIRILSIEDDPEMRGLLQLILERRGHHVMGVKRGELGLELLKSLKPDVLLLDLMLPDIDGWEIYHQMKADEDLSHMPVIIISARDQRQDAAAGNEVIGKDRYLQKPFDIEQLLSTVYEVIEKHPLN